jgi:glycine/D-amino acid oxidase-like deaminating enzyme
MAAELATLWPKRLTACARYVDSPLTNTRSLLRVIDPTGGGAVASVARSGVYDATQLRVDPSATLRDFADRLRERGIFLEKLPIRGGSGGTGGTVWDGGSSTWDAGGTTWDT